MHQVPLSRQSIHLGQEHARERKLTPRPSNGRPGRWRPVVHVTLHPWTCSKRPHPRDDLEEVGTAILLITDPVLDERKKRILPRTALYHAHTVK